MQPRPSHQKRNRVSEKHVYFLSYIAKRMHLSGLMFSRGRHFMSEKKGRLPVSLPK